MKKAMAQQDNLGCSIACLAFILNKNYQEVVENMGKENAESEGFLLPRNC